MVQIQNRIPFLMIIAIGCSTPAVPRTCSEYNQFVECIQDRCAGLVNVLDACLFEQRDCSAEYARLLDCAEPCDRRFVDCGRDVYVPCFTGCEYDTECLSQCEREQIICNLLDPETCDG